MAGRGRIGRGQARSSTRAVAAALLVTWLVAAPASADRGDWGGGAHLGWVAPRRALLGGEAFVGLGDALQATAVVVGEHHAANAAGRRWAGRLLAGPTVLWDVLRWVPAATILFGAELEGGRGWRPAALARAELRYFLSRRTLAAVGVGGLWSRGRLAPELSLMLAWQS